MDDASADAETPDDDEPDAETPDDEPFVPAAGVELGCYTLETRLGRGSMGEVWRASGPDGPVAIKIPLRPAFLRHLRKERLFLANVDHPNVARFIAADLDNDPSYLVTELVRGQPLRVLCRGTISPHGAVLICDQLLAGVQAIHEAGILHLDLKPENVIVQQDGAVKIVDLGLGRATTSFMEEVYLSVSLASRVPAVAGTLAYMSPEQRRGKPVDARTDLFAFGILLHELLTGRLPEPGTPITDFREKLAPRWDVVVARLTHPKPDSRPADAKEVRHLVSFTLAEKASFAVPTGGVEPRDLLSYDEESFAEASPYVPGMVLGEGYELEHLLGRGGYGEVWRVRRGVEHFALKVVLSEGAREGLAKEADVARRVEHKGVPKLVADCSDAQPPHVVFGIVEGRSLRLIIHEEDELSLGAALGIFERMLDVVDSCARAGVVHMDLKPEHFLVAGDWERPTVSLIDFGLSALVSPTDLDGSLGTDVAVRGTFDYMAPEQREGKVSPAVDVYALGLCLFELLTLGLPKGPQRLATLRRGVPHELDRLVHAMLSTDPQTRPSLSSCLAQVNTIRGKVSSRTARGARPGVVRIGIFGRIRRVIQSLPPKLAIFLFGLVGLGFMAFAYRAPELLFEFRTRHYSAADVYSLDSTDFPEDRETLKDPRQLPARSGKVMILRESLTAQFSGRTGAARIDEAWARLPAELRAERPSEVKTVVSVFVLGAKVVISVYDLPSKRLLGRYDVSELGGYPTFLLGGRRTDLAEFVQVMPTGSPKPLAPKPKKPLLPPTLPNRPPTSPERRRNLQPESGE